MAKNHYQHLLSVQYIVNYFPALKPYLCGKKSNIDSLSEIEKTFLAQCHFFINPKESPFDFRLVYLHLDYEWAMFSIKAFEIYIEQDTYLKVSESDMKKESNTPLYNISRESNKE